MRLLLDEMYPRSLARELRARSHDVISVDDAPGGGTPNEDVLVYACDEGRAVATENVRDYRPLAEARIADGRSHCGWAGRSVPMSRARRSLRSRAGRTSG